MTALRGSTARLLLDRVPEQDRVDLVRNVVSSLREQGTKADIGFATTILSIQPDERAETELVKYLQTLIEVADDDQAVAVCSDHTDLGQKVIKSTISSIGNASAHLEMQSGAGLAIPTAVSSQQVIADLSKSTVNRLRFASHIITTFNVTDTDLNELFQYCTVLVGARERNLYTAAQGTLFAIFSLQRHFATSDQESLWNRIKRLVTATDPMYQTLALSIWLRWIASESKIDQSILQQPEYWSLLVGGLRRGDSERRKTSLQIFRASIDTSIQEPELITLLTAESKHDLSPQLVQKQYARFCTVFETITLGRYLNQVQECEPDLDFFSSSQSLVKPMWIYTLLSCALDQNMQEANRKFIGNWIMRSNLRTDDPNGYLKLFREDFIPWAAAGTLFTSTLRKTGVLRCGHGEKLAKLISRSLKDNPDLAYGLISSILDSIICRQVKNFAYTMVYMIDGIGQAVDSDQNLIVAAEQLVDIGKIPTWAGLPEIARDYMLARYWKLCHQQSQRVSSPSEAVLSAAAMWEILRERSKSMDSGSSAHVDGNIASMALEPSGRDVNEQKSIEKCVRLVDDLENLDVPVDQQYVQDAIEDIWDDLEYLVYPKSLLVVLPSLIPHPRLVQEALSLFGDDGPLASTLSSKTIALLEVAQTRSYLLSPLATRIRRVALEWPAATEQFQLKNFVIGLAEHPPTPTIDAQLDDATIPLLQALDANLSRYNHEYYSGPRESRGVAALLDLVSRLGAAGTDTVKQILDHLLQRWLRQKIPPPTVSPWKTTLQLQVMLLCLEQILPGLDIERSTSLLKDLHYILSIEPLPRYRYLEEWMIARIYVHYPTLRSTIFEELRTKDHHSNPKFLASLMKIGVAIAKTEGASEAFTAELAIVFIPLAASSKIVIRHEAQWQIPVLMDHARDRSWSSVANNKSFEELDAFIRSLMRFGDPPLERQIDKLDPIRDHNMAHLVEGPWWALDHIERPQTTHQDFLQLYASDQKVQIKLLNPCLPLGLAPSTSHHSPQSTIQTRKPLQNASPISDPDAGPNALQTKGAAYLSSARTRHANLLVIGSLVDNPHNLGGLSRVSEIFGAGALYMQNPSVAKTSQDFAAVSVSSHLHLPIHALSAADLPAWLEARKKRPGPATSSSSSSSSTTTTTSYSDPPSSDPGSGYTIIGIEQTSRSVKIGSEACIFPPRSILVLGSEREGIPALVLSQCDLLVEIPQVGVTRSLNVQTAAGIVLCEYARQHAGRS